MLVAVVSFKLAMMSEKPLLTGSHSSYLLPAINALCLLKALQFHVNLKAVTGVGCIKYIFKYIMKGPERASVKIRTQKKTGEIINEADIILDSRPVCSFESASKILGHKQQEIFPAVQRLPCILPEKEVIYW